MRFPWRPRSLFWPIAGMALVTLILGTMTQFWVVDGATEGDDPIRAAPAGAFADPLPPL